MACPMRFILDWEFVIYSNEEWQYFIGELVIAASFGFVGYRKDTKLSTTPDALPAADARPCVRYDYKLAGVTFKNEYGYSLQSAMRNLNLLLSPI